MQERKQAIALNAQEKNLIALIRRLGYGEIVLQVQDGKPVEIAELRRSMMLDR